MRKKTIASWVASLPPEAVAIRIRLGTGRAQPTLSIIAIEDSGYDSDDAGIIYCKITERAALIEDLALDAGWGEEEPTLRLHALSVKNKPLASWQNTKRGKETPQKNSDYAIAALTDGILSMSAQLTQTIDILTESLAHSESSRAHMFEAMLEAREDQLGAEMSAVLSQMESEPEPPDPLKAQAVQALSSVASVLAGGVAQRGEPTFTAEDVRRKAESDIWFASDLAAEYSKMNNAGAPNVESDKTTNKQAASAEETASPGEKE